VTDYPETGAVAAAITAQADRVDHDLQAQIDAEVLRRRRLRAMQGVPANRFAVWNSQDITEQANRKNTSEPWQFGM
jgi:hypothetical protein